MNKAQFLSLLDHFGACGHARLWAQTQPTPSRAWERCSEPQWMLWIASRLGINRCTLIRAACDIARLSLAVIPKGEDRPAKLIKVVVEYTRGRATKAQVHAARKAVVRLRSNTIVSMWDVYHNVIDCTYVCTQVADMVLEQHQNMEFRELDDSAYVADVIDVLDDGSCGFNYERLPGRIAAIVRKRIPYSVLLKAAQKKLHSK